MQIGIHSQTARIIDMFNLSGLNGDDPRGSMLTDMRTGNALLRAEAERATSGVFLSPRSSSVNNESFNLKMNAV